MEVRFRRSDGSFVAVVNGFPYHVTKSDPLFGAAHEEASLMGDALPFEPEQEHRRAQVADVVVERDRRLCGGFDYDFGDARGVHRIGTTAEDQRGWSEVTTIALARHAQGDATPITVVTDTGPAQVTPAEWLAILSAAADFRQPIWAASFVLQTMNPIPADLNDDRHWP